MPCSHGRKYELLSWFHEEARKQALQVWFVLGGREGLVRVSAACDVASAVCGGHVQAPPGHSVWISIWVTHVAPAGVVRSRVSMLPKIRACARTHTHIHMRACLPTCLQVVAEVTKHLVETHRDCVVAVQPVFNNEYEVRGGRR